jgi:hypothetical protein
LLEDFYTEARCLDFSYVELKVWISMPEMDEALRIVSQVNRFCWATLFCYPWQSVVQYLASLSMIQDGRMTSPG